MRLPCCALAAVPTSRVESRALRLGIPSKGRMAELTLELLDECQLTVRKVNERQYVANMPNVANLEVWFQRASDVMRKLRAGDLDLGIVGYDMFVELGEARRGRVQLVPPCALAHLSLPGRRGPGGGARRAGLRAVPPGGGGAAGLGRGVVAG